MPADTLEMMLNRKGLRHLRKSRANMRRLLQRELKRLLSELERVKAAGRMPPNAVVIRLQQIREHLKRKPVLLLLPEWFV